MSNIAHHVKCFYCNKTFDRDKEPFEQIPNKKRYAHKECYNKVNAAQLSNDENKEKLENYIKNLFGYKNLPEKVNRQIKQFIVEYNYNYLGILRALTYFYEVRNGNKEKAHGGIGIVPWIYDEAHTYYLSLWEARQVNEVATLKIQEYILPTVEVHILPPEREPMKKKRKLFTFLEEQEEVNE